MLTQQSKAWCYISLFRIGNSISRTIIDVFWYNPPRPKGNHIISIRCNISRRLNGYTIQPKASKKRQEATHQQSQGKASEIVWIKTQPESGRWYVFSPDVIRFFVCRSPNQQADRQRSWQAGSRQASNEHVHWFNTPVMVVVHGRHHVVADYHLVRAK